MNRTWTRESWCVGRRLVGLLALGCALLSFASMSREARGEEPKAETPKGETPKAEASRSPASRVASLPNVVTPTMGGKQLWTDELVWCEWRIQRNVWTGHYRLLDPNDQRRAWGTWDQCRAKWDETRREAKLPEPSGTVVVLVHGLGRSRASMEPLAKYLRDEGHFTVVNATYASTRDDIGGHAQALGRVVANLRGAEQIHFVGHSLGNLVIRHYLYDRTQAPPETPADPPIGRIVMLGPPNQGAQIARRLHGNSVFRLVAGRSAQQMGGAWEEIERHLAVPDVPFGIIAGGNGESGGRNPLIDGDDDLLVSVEETKLPGASDFQTVPLRHAVLRTDPQVHVLTLRFLQDGYFKSAAERRPLAP